MNTAGSHPEKEPPDAETAGAPPEPDTGHDVIARNSRSLRNGLISLTVFFALIVALLLAVPSLRAAIDRISDAGAAWVLAGIGLELLSCAGYVVLFSLVFDGIGRRLVVRLSLSELAVNSVVSASGLAGIALGAWVLKSRGYSTEMVARRSVLLFVLASAVNVAAVVVIGVPMWLGVIPGSTNPLLTLVPALAGDRGDSRHPRRGHMGAPRGRRARNGRWPFSSRDDGRG